MTETKDTTDTRIGHRRGFNIYEKPDGTMYAEFTTPKRGTVRVGEGSVEVDQVVSAIHAWYNGGV